MQGDVQAQSDGKRGQRLVSSSLLALKHSRLMLLGFCLGLMLGVIYYTYSKSVYMSRCMVRWDAVNAPFQQTYDIQALAASLSSRSVTELAAKRLGLVSERGSFEWIRDAIVKRLDVKVISRTTLSIDVFPFRKDILTSFPKAMLEVISDDLSKDAMEARTKQLARYKEEMELLRKKMSEEREENMDFAEKNSATQLFIEQQGLSQVPRELVITKARVDAFDRMKARLERGDLDAVSKLSLLNSFLNSGRVSVGSVLHEDDGATAPAPDAVRGSSKEQKAREQLTRIVPAMGAAPAESPAPDVVVVPSMVENLQSWQGLERRRRVLMEQIEAGARTYLPGHKYMRDLNRQLADVEQGLNAELEVSLRKLDLEHAALKERLHHLQDQMPNYEEVMRKYQDFQDNFALKNGSQLGWNEAYLKMAQELTKTDYLNQPRAALPQIQFLGFTILREDPVSPPKGKLMLIAVVIGVGLAGALPLLVERANDTVSRMEDLESQLNLPGLGVIPIYDPKDLENLVRSPELDSTAPDWLLENFRTIRSGIALNKEVQGASQVVMVTSARPREGKTTVAMNLAWSFASMGERTILLDCDLRRGRLHRSLNLENEVGITSVLMRGVPWADAVQKTPHAGLDVLSRGGVIPGATEALCRTAFANLIAELRPVYQRIVLDTPPILGLSEPASLQRVVDGTLLVVLAEQTPQKDVVQALSVLRKSGGRFYGFVLNRLDLSSLRNYYNYSHYSPYYYSVMDENEAASSKA